MKNTFFLCSIAVCTFAGCASVAVTDDILQVRTSKAINIPQGEFVIQDRSDSGFQTDYVAKTKNQTYKCFVQGVVSVAGRVVSEATCTLIASTPVQAQTQVQPQPPVQTAAQQTSSTSGTSNTSGATSTQKRKPKPKAASTATACSAQMKSAGRC